ncbi:MAG: type II secretion system F family protein [Methanosarcinaceae archaeon]
MKKMIPVTALCLCSAFCLMYLLVSGKVSGDDYIFSMFLLFLLPLSLKVFLDYRRLSSKEKNYPVFVRDLTLNIKTGMEPLKAIVMLEDNDYGALGDDVKLLSSNLKLGVPLDQALEVMAHNTKSRKIKRTISVISGSVKTGGRIEEVFAILTAYLVNDREMKSGINSKLFIYQLTFFVIYIIFIAMNYFLHNNILPMMGESGFPVDEEFYGMLMFRSTMLLGVFMGLVSGKLAKGSISGGMPNVFLLVFVGWVLSRTIL